jgi:hypothetical protein
MAEIDNQTASYRTCFNTDAGKRVLGHLLLEAGYFDVDLKTPEEQAVLNYAKKILKNIGLFSMKENGIVGIDSFTNKLFELPSE